MDFRDLGVITYGDVYNFETCCMSDLPDLEAFLGLSIVAQLNLSLRTLDAIGAKISASHVDAALHALREEARCRHLSSDKLCAAIELDFSILDDMAENIYRLN